MPVINATSGTPIPRFANEILANLLTQAELKFGKGVRNKANTIRQTLELYGVLGFADLEQDFLDWMAQMDPRAAQGQALVDLLWPLFEPLPARLSSGIVNVNYTTIPTAPTPMFAAGDLDFVDGGGNHYTLSATVNPPLKVFDSNETGTATETFGGVNTKASQQFPLNDDEFVQAVRIVVSAIISGSPVATVRIETDDGTGKASGVLAAGTLEKTGVALVVGSNDVVIENGANLESGTYHIVVVPTSGEFTLDGGAGGPAARAKKFTGGSWVNLTTVQNLNLEVIEGGVFPVTSDQVGPQFNIDALAIAAASPNNPTASALFNTVAGAFTNPEAFTGGRIAEQSDSLRTRARLAKAARYTGSVNGISTFLSEFVDGVESADVVENVTMDWQQADTLIDNGGISGSNQTIDGTNTRVAQKVVVSSPSSVMAVAVDWATMSALDFDLRVEGDTAGAPSGALVSARTVLPGVTPAGTGREVYTLTFPAGDVLPVGTYWVVLQRNSGSASILGENTSGDDAAQVYTGSWALATPDNLAIEVFGGLPPKSIRAYVDGNVDPDEVALALSSKAGGIWTDGPNVGYAADARGVLVPYRYFESVKVPVVIRIDLNVDASFLGSEDTIRDLLIENIGGVDTEGDSNPGLGISREVVYNELKAVPMPVNGADPRTNGIKNYTGDVFYLARKSDVATPGALNGAHVIDLPVTRGERFIVEDPDDIEVNLTVV